MLHQLIITSIIALLAISAIAELIFPSKLLGFVGITSNLHTEFLLRTTAVALIALLPSLWAARSNVHTPTSRSPLFGIAIYMFLSSVVDFQAFAQGIVNSMSVPSIILRVLLGIAILGLIIKSPSIE